MRACGCTLNNAYMQHSLLALVGHSGAAHLRPRPDRRDAIRADERASRYGTRVTEQAGDGSSCSQVSENHLKRDIWTRNHGGQLLARKAVGTTLDEKVGFLAASSRRTNSLRGYRRARLGRRHEPVVAPALSVVRSSAQFQPAKRRPSPLPMPERTSAIRLLCAP